MVSWFKSLRERWAKRRAERRATVAERTLRENERQAARWQHERKSDNARFGP